MICPRPAILILLAAITAFAPPVAAQTNLATAEDVAFAFFKTAGQSPDWDNWARASDGYKTSAPALADKFLKDEKQRLLRKWQAELLPLEVKMTLPVTLFAGTQNDVPEYWLSFDIPRTEPFFLPYHYREYDIALMPDGLQKLATHKVEKAQYDLIFSALGDRTSAAADLYISFIPVRSYTDEPVDLNGTMQWVMIVRPAAATMRGENGAVLWSYAQDRYITPEVKGVRALYDAEGTQNTLSFP
jgi:hypothetical protein